MPTYEFWCETCHKTLEEFYQAHLKPDTLQCPICHKTATTIISGGQGFHLKGSGWSFDRYAGKSNFSFGEDKDD